MSAFALPFCSLAQQSNIVRKQAISRQLHRPKTRSEGHEGHLVPEWWSEAPKLTVSLSDAVRQCTTCGAVRDLSRHARCVLQRTDAGVVESRYPRCSEQRGCSHHGRKRQRQRTDSAGTAPPFSPLQQTMG